MKTSFMSTACVLLTGAVLAGQALHPPVVLKVGDDPIDVNVGHAAPCLFDWNGDGRADLLVGQFGEGKLRIYLDVAKQGEPRYEGFNYFQADGADGTVPAS